MKVLTIEIDGEYGFDVVDEQGRRCGGLAWGEMLEQVAIMTIPVERLGKGYAMKTDAEWEAIRDASRSSHE